jgi:hypothetical protein
VRALGLALVLVATSAHANGIAGGPHRHEALLNSSLGTTLNVETGMGGERLEVAVGYLYSVCPLVQWGGVLGTGYQGKGFLNVLALVNLNFKTSDDGRHSLFVGGGAGWDDVTASTREFVWRAEVGMRFRLFEHLYWRPSAGVLDTGSGPGVAAQLLALSLTY